MLCSPRVNTPETEDISTEGERRGVSFLLSIHPKLATPHWGMQPGEDYKPRATGQKLEDFMEKLRLSEKVRGTRMEG